MKNLKCLFCGGDLCWNSDANASETYAEYTEDDTAVISYYTCMKCGRSYEISEPNKEDRKREYKEYWENGER